MKIRDKITDVLIEHSETQCPHCEHPLEIPDIETEDAILRAIVDWLLSYSDDHIPDELRALSRELNETKEK